MVVCDKVDDGETALSADATFSRKDRMRSRFCIAVARDVSRSLETFKESTDVFHPESMLSARNLPHSTSSFSWFETIKFNCGEELCGFDMNWSTLRRTASSDCGYAFRIVSTSA